MLTDEDLNKIIEAEKEVFPTKEDFASFKDEMKESFSDLQTSVDGYVQKGEDYFKEMKVLSHKVKCHEKWIEKVADKLGIKIEYL